MLSPQLRFPLGPPTSQGKVQAPRCGFIPQCKRSPASGAEEVTGLGTAGTRSPRGLPSRAENPGYRSGSSCFLAQPRNPCWESGRVEQASRKCKGRSWHAGAASCPGHLNGLAGDRKGSCSSVGWVCPGRPRGPRFHGPGQTPKQPEPGACGCRILLFLPHEHAPAGPGLTGMVPG